MLPGLNSVLYSCTAVWMLFMKSSIPNPVIDDTPRKTTTQLVKDETFLIKRSGVCNYQIFQTEIVEESRFEKQNTIGALNQLHINKYSMKRRSNNESLADRNSLSIVLFLKFLISWLHFFPVQQQLFTHIPQANFCTVKVTHNYNGFFVNSKRLSQTKIQGEYKNI